MLTKIAFWPRRCVKGQLRCQFCGKKWKCNFLHAANVAVLRPRSCSGQQEQGGDVAKLTFHISRHLPSAPIIALVLVQEAASDTKRVALFPPACPTNPDDIARPKAGEEGVCLPVRADPGSSPKTRP